MNWLWFRMWVETRMDKKLDTLDGRHSEFGVWFDLLCLAGAGGGRIPPMDEEELALEVAGEDVELLRRVLAKLQSKKLGIIEMDDKGGIVFLNFAKRNPRCPSETPEAVRERVRRHRMKRDVTTCNDLDKNREEKKRKEKKKSTTVPSPSSILQKEGKSLTLEPSDVIEIWNEVCGQVLPRAEKLTDKRRQHIRRRIAEDPHRASPDWWRAYFDRIRRTSFLCGDNSRGWLANLDFAVRSEDVVVQVFEGKYGTPVRMREERTPVEVVGHAEQAAILRRAAEEARARGDPDASFYEAQAEEYEAAARKKGKKGAA
ncbi:MAG: hypothetical protein C4551_02440 [Bacillota bacterium]|nr:MAG: hypothetical protein C4551_02440 [Bacillota bacterium]